MAGLATAAGADNLRFPVGSFLIEAAQEPAAF
jgi:hypothetical protein